MWNFHKNCCAYTVVFYETKNKEIRKRLIIEHMFRYGEKGIIRNKTEEK